MEWMGFVFTIFVGVVLGLMGAGGAILMVPILVYLFHFSPIEATSYSLFVVGITAILGGIQYFQNHQVNGKVVFLFGLPGWLGVMFSRKLLLPQLPEQMFFFTKGQLVMVVFAVLMLMASLNMIRKKKNTHAQHGVHKNYFRILMQGFFVGMVTGFVGAGGGFLIVPALVLMIGLGMRVAVGTSLVIIAMNSLFGFLLEYEKWNQLQWKFLFTIVILSILGFVVGYTLHKKISEEKLKPAFGWFVLVTGVFVLLDQIRQWVVYVRSDT